MVGDHAFDLMLIEHLPGIVNFQVVWDVRTGEGEADVDDAGIDDGVGPEGACMKADPWIEMKARVQQGAADEAGGV